MKPNHFFKSAKYTAPYWSVLYAACARLVWPGTVRHESAKCHLCKIAASLSRQFLSAAAAAAAIFILQDDGHDLLSLRVWKRCS